MAHDAPEVVKVTTTRVACDGGEGGHPRVWLQMPNDANWVACPYCDCRFVLKKGAKAGH